MRQMVARRNVLGAGLGLGMTTMLGRRARAAEAPIKIGVLTDMSGAYVDNTGPGSVLGAKLAIEDYAKIDPAVKVELVQADMLNKPDVALGIAGTWYGNDGVNLILDLPLSSAALGLATMAKERDKVAILTGAGTADLTGKACGPNHLHWVYDTWSLPAGVARALVAEGADTWYFITADYAYGHSLEVETTGHVTRAGGKVLGAARTPFPGTTDFSAYLVQAQASGAKVLGAGQWRRRYGELHQAGGRVRSDQARHAHCRPGVPDRRRARTRAGRHAGRDADRTVLLGPERRHAGLFATLRRAAARPDAVDGSRRRATPRCCTISRRYRCWDRPRRKPAAVP